MTNESKPKTFGRFAHTAIFALIVLVPLLGRPLTDKEKEQKEIAAWVAAEKSKEIAKRSSAEALMAKWAKDQ